jgi:hypothetical protein
MAVIRAHSGDCALPRPIIERSNAIERIKARQRVYQREHDRHARENALDQQDIAAAIGRCARGSECTKA